MITTLSPNREGFQHLLSALQKSRSIAEEHGINEMNALLDIEPTGAEKLVNDDRTLDLLVDLLDGTRTCEPTLWMNLAALVDRAPSWGISLAARGVEMPSVIDAYRDAQQLLSSH